MSSHEQAPQPSGGSRPCRRCFIMSYLQAQHVDTEFCDGFFRAGAYLPTHAGHLQRWH